jgi:hypothetical protein
MADLNQESQELADVVARVNDDLRRFGRLTQETADALAAGSERRAQELKKSGQQAAQALTDVAGAAMSSARAMYQGQKGAAAFNSALDNLSSAATAAATGLALLAPGGIVIKGLLTALTVTAGALTKYTKAANEMADTLYKSYAGLARSGAAAADGMTGLFEDAKKLGVSMNELDGYVNLVAQSSRDLALFGGAVFEGRKRFADLGRDMEPFREALLAAGITMEEQREGMMGYIRLQSRIGQVQNQTAAQLADGVRRYLIEQDALTKLTGETRQEQEQAREEARSIERFAGRLEELRQQGLNDQAKELEDTFIILRSQSRDAALGFADITSNTVQTEAAQKSLMATQGESMRAAQQLSAGQINAAQAAGRIAREYGVTATRLGPSMAQIGTFAETFGPLEQAQRLRALGERDLNKELAKIQEEQQRMGITGAQAADELTRRQAKLIDTQIQANEALERFVFRGIDEAQVAMQRLADTTVAGAEGLNSLLDSLFGSTRADFTRLGPSQTRGDQGGPLGQSSAMAGGTQALLSPPSTSGEPTLSQLTASPAYIAARRSGQAPREALEAARDSLGARRKPDTQAESAPGTDSVIKSVVSAAPYTLTIVDASGKTVTRQGGTRSWRNNNPGNIEYGDFAQAKGAVGSDGRFAVFPTLQQGRQAKDDLLFGQRSLYADMSISRAIARYAPFGENNPVTYAQQVASAVGVSVSTRLRDLDQTQRQRFLDAIQRAEGYEAGEIIKAAKGGVFSGPREGYPAELHGNEAVVPLPDGKSIPVDLNSKVVQKVVSDILNPVLSGPMFRQSVTGQDLQQDIKTLLVSIDGLVDQISDPELQPKMMADGGITQGVSIAGEAGPEAVVPLPDGKSIPVEMGDAMIGAISENQRSRREMHSLFTKVFPDMLSTAEDVHAAFNRQKFTDVPALVQATLDRTFDYFLPTFGGFNPYTGYRAGPLQIGNKQMAIDAGLYDPRTGLIPQGDTQEGAKAYIDRMLDYVKFEMADVVMEMMSGGSKGSLSEYTESGIREIERFAKGGITSGISIAGESGPEAVVPLPDGKTIPVTINLRDPEQTGPTAMGFNEYRGYNAGPVSTDINALKDIAGQLGAFDRATQTITDPETWKKILNSGMLLNYNTGFVEIGTRLAPGIGVEIGERVKEIMATDNTNITEALSQVKGEFAAAMSQVVEQLIAAQRDSYPQEVIDILERIDRNQSRVADSSQRMAEVAAN